MLVFVTGAPGFIGRATIEELHKHGHEVLGLARSDASAEKISKLGAQVHRGDLEDLESLRTGAKKADGVIHLAFIHDFSNYERAGAADRAAIEAMAEAMAGTGKPLVIASGTMLAVKGQLATEDAEPERGTPFAMRQESADLVVKLSKEKGIRGSIIRLPPTVHGKEDKGLIPMYIDGARKAGAVSIVGDGSNRWCAVHRQDAAVLFRLALEKGVPGGTYHAVAEQGVPWKDIANVVGKNLQLPVENKSSEEAMKTLGFLALVFGADNPASSEKTQRELGWDPRASGQPELLADLEANYFS
ncbi:uncharacterized protein Z520_03944 [Fonsecaea multimorphosa CBS 102226]|uniref:NAD-dependent epimerase/dehydratase domain-containing protein n=1 Tax=Fonsecaea multimorphosa CBS 102226 TaxID=1442371 RepID=A0A0D2KU26_9EURO|nr:uncharacterized protein Z520_03944 [Fonsecaea multimorphosa CBS 102226]KIY00259.1 hypothetical protein Z520_03944 [Fonsecaea multimorphosa CBS 102226]OAL27095.1 hypothetical protein AYO22_03726 [Fonsecaea multimorphosa]